MNIGQAYTLEPLRCLIPAVRFGPDVLGPPARVVLANGVMVSVLRMDLPNQPPTLRVLRYLPP